MIKCFSVLPKRPDISDEKFHAHWRGIHAEHAKRIPSIRRYVQSHRIPERVPGFRPAPYEGSPETWFDDFETAISLRESREHREGALLDEPNFIDVPRMQRVATTEHVVLAGPDMQRRSRPLKVLLFLKRKAGLTVEDFQRRWLGEHAALAKRLPSLLRHVQCTPLAQLYAAPVPPAFDGVEELWWPDLTAYRACSSSAQWRAAQIENLGALIDLGTSAAFAAEENRVIWP